jgi:site-specific recombinase XerD
MYNTGARVQEIADIRLNDLRLDAASQVKLTGKGKKERVIPLWEDTIEAIKTYMSERKTKQENEDHLFLNDKGESITRFGIRYIVKKYTDKAIGNQPSLKQKKVSPHTFRHTTAMHLLQAGNELNVVRL